MAYKMELYAYLPNIFFFSFRIKVGSGAGSGSELIFQLSRIQIRGKKKSDPHPWLQIGSCRDDYRGYLLCKLVSTDANNQCKEY